MHHEKRAGFCNCKVFWDAKRSAARMKLPDLKKFIGCKMRSGVGRWRHGKAEQSDMNRRQNGEEKG